MNWKHMIAVFNSAGRDVRVRADPSTSSLQIIPYAHHEVHGGSHFTYSQIDADWDIDEPVELLIVVPNTAVEPHLIIDVVAALDTNVKLYESTTHTVLAAQAAFNNNRNSATVNTTTINTHNDDGANGNLIFESQFGIAAGTGANRITGGGMARSEQEWVLKRNTKYLLIIASGTDTSSLSIKLSWYEHAPHNS